MLKKALLSIAVVALAGVSALAVPPVPEQPTPGYIAQTEIPVCIIIDKYAEITVLDDCLLLMEKPGENWQGSTMVTIINNWTVIVTATIEPYEPSIVDPVNGTGFLCWFEGAQGPISDTSVITLHPYPDGYTVRLWAAIGNPNLLARASSPDPQRVATIYLTVQN